MTATHPIASRFSLPNTAGGFALTPSEPPAVKVPVAWGDDPDSHVEIVSTSIADLRGVLRLARDLRAGRPANAAPDSRFAGQVARFVAIGVLSTLAYAARFLVLRFVLLRSWDFRARRAAPAAAF